MFLRYFYDEKLAQASYMVGCQKTGEAIIIDPARDISPYVKTAEEQSFRITGAAETHIHADFVSGARELEDAFKAKMYLSDEGDQEWKYENLSGVNHQLLKDKDTFTVGNLLFEVIHTPGHTPESISYLLTDKGGGASEPIGIFTGDFVFAGDIGRPDLLEKAAGKQGTAENGAKQMFQSLKKFKELPDYLQVWPGHGAGSACGKSLGAVPSTTAGYEKMVNWALNYESESDFTRALLEDQPEPPVYFAEMKRVNKVGPALLRTLSEVKLTGKSELEDEGIQIIDTRTSAEFAKGHLKGTINIPFNQSFTNWAGWLIDYRKPMVFLTDMENPSEITKALRSIGVDEVHGYGHAGDIVAKASSLESYDEVSPKEIEQKVKEGSVHVLDVRSQSEWQAGHIKGAQHIMLGTLPDRVNEVKDDKEVIVQCGSGMRSAIGVSVLQAHGMKNVKNLTGGFTKWKKETDSETIEK
ncbi:rhodanese-like domain-containing protein [Metabacillus sp. 113a]|uniref:MBL fold metallo-hydrolase n=1 Tax=Metabacillus sp. 113a TaxID=3404706 RepID=UPI003CE9FCE0